MSHNLKRNFLAEIESGSQAEHVMPYMYHLLAARVANPNTPISREAIISNLSGVLLGGVDTTSNTLQWFLWNLVSFPEKQKKIKTRIEIGIKRSRNCWV